MILHLGTRHPQKKRLLSKGRKGCCSPWIFTLHREGPQSLGQTFLSHKAGKGLFSSKKGLTYMPVLLYPAVDLTNGREKTFRREVVSVQNTCRLFFFVGIPKTTQYTKSLRCISAESFRACGVVCVGLGTTTLLHRTVNIHGFCGHPGMPALKAGKSLRKSLGIKC